MFQCEQPQRPTRGELVRQTPERRDEKLKPALSRVDEETFEDLWDPFADPRFARRAPTPTEKIEIIAKDASRHKRERKTPTIRFWMLFKK